MSSWRDFELLVARIESAAGPLGMNVKSPDRIRSRVTGRLREVDASIRTKIGTSEILITIECRKRKAIQDVTWIEQLATKKQAIGAARTIAVSSTGFSADAELAAKAYGIDLRSINEFSIEEINTLLKIDYVVVAKRHCSLAQIWARKFQGLENGWTLPLVTEASWVAPEKLDTHQKIFFSTDTNLSWSINDIWLQMQQAVNPFEGVEEQAGWQVRTLCMPYPGNVVLQCQDTRLILGDVVLGVALAITLEVISLNDATKIEYSSPDGEVIQRVEFEWDNSCQQRSRMSLQIPKRSNDVKDLNVRSEW